jgi:hypothetical protein
MLTLAIFVAGIGSVWGQQVSVNTTSNAAGNYSWTCPPGVTSITVECWGAGGKGGARASSTGSCGGGGGGAYSSSILTVTPGTTYLLTLGAGATTTNAGGDTYFGNTTAGNPANSLVLAKGGSSVANNTTTGAAGGLSTNGIGTIKYSGGNGFTATTGGGGGGSSAGTGANGNPATSTTGATAPTGGGKGGNGRTTSTGVGLAGATPGGGGGGAYRTTSGSTAGGAGGKGVVIITYTQIYCVPTATSDDATGITNVTINTLNYNSNGNAAYSNFSLQSTNLVKGESYNLTVNVNTGGDYTNFSRAWIDWDKDGVFSDNEFFDLGSATNVTSGLCNITAVVTVPDNIQLGNYTLRVRTCNDVYPVACGNINYSEAEDYTIVVVNPPIPTVSSFLPVSFCAGQQVTITGTGFRNTNNTGNPATHVKFNGVDAVSFTVVSATQITAFAPETTNGTISVTNSSGTGTSASSFTLQAAPSAPTLAITAPSSSTINVGGTTTITASGSGGTLNWYDAFSGGNLINTGTSYDLPTQCTSGVKTFYVEEVGSGCNSLRASVNVTVRNMIAPNPANALICSAEGSVTLSTQLTGGSNISWSPNTNLSATSGASTIASPSATTVYTMTATVTGCVGNVTATQTVGVIEGVNITPTSNSSSICAGNTATLSSNLNASNFTASCVTARNSLSTPPVGAVTLCNNGSVVTSLTSGGLDDGFWNNRPIGFTFNYFGVNHTNVMIGTNGTIVVGGGSSFQYNFTGGFPNAANPPNCIAACARDLQLSSTGGNFGFGAGIVRHWTEGTAPTRKFIVQYANCATWYSTNGTDGRNSVEVVLNETTGIVEIYVIEASNPAATTGTWINDTRNKFIGLQNGAKTIGATSPNCSTNAANYWNGVSDQITAGNGQAWKFVPGATYDFQWSTAGSNINNAQSTGYTTPVLNTPGSVSYSVSATNQSTGCSSSGSVNITVNALPSAPVSAGNPTECGNAANQNLVVSVGDGETADWYGASSGGSVLTTPSNGTATTSYSVPANTTATYHAQARNTTTGCISSSRTEVTFTTKLVPTAPTASAVSYCQGATSNPMTASTPVGSNTQNWYTDPTGGTPLAGAPTPSTATVTTLTYYVSEVGTNGCESTRTSVTASITAQPPTPTAISASRCGDGTLTLGVEASQNGTIKWYADPGFSTLVASIPACTTATPCTTSWTTPSLSSTTTYYATRTNLAGCESASVAVTATINPNIIASVSNSASSTSACGGGAITFTATPTNGGTPTYQWYLNGVTVGTNSTTYELASPADGDDIYVAMTPSAQTCLTSASATNSNTVTLTSSASTPSVAIQSSSIAAICPGTSVTFSVNSSANMGATPSYVWKLNGSPISGATNATYTSTSLVNNDQVTLTMTSSLGGACLTQSDATSSAITTSVNAATSITTQPSATSACASGTANFTVVGAGQGTLAYQWKKNDINIANNGTATSSSLTLSGVSASEVTNYTVVVTGDCGSVTSNTAAFTLKTPTSISVHPSAVTTCTNNDANFSVTAAGQGTLSYQWTFGGSSINTATNSSYTASGVTSANAGSYRVIVTGECGAITSNPAALTVQPATVIATQPSASTLCQNNTANFSVSATGQGILSYQWKREGNNVGTNSASLSVSNAQSVNAGSYTVDVTGGCGTTTSNAAVLTVNPSTSITTQPVGTSGCEGQNTTFTVVAAGTGSLSYQWKYGATDVGTNSASYNIPSTSFANDGNYSVVVTGTCGNATSSTVALNVYLSPTTNATISTADITDATLCGKNTVDVVANSPGAESVGSWSVVGGFDITPANASATSTTFTAANSALGGQAKKLVWSHIRETNGNFCYTRDTLTVDFKQPITNITINNNTIGNGDYLFTGTNSRSVNNFRNWHILNNGVYSNLSSVNDLPQVDDEVFIISSTEAQNCVSATNIPCVPNGNSFLVENVFVGDGAEFECLGTGQLNFSGDFINRGTFSAANGTINLSGTGNQSVVSVNPITFNNLSVNKNSGNVILNAPVIVNGTLNMTQGDIISSATNLITIGTSSSSPGSIVHNGGKVIGPLRRYFDAAATPGDGYYFPVGNNANANTRGVTIDFNGSPGDNQFLTIEYKSGYAGGVSPLITGLPLTTNDGVLIQNLDDEGYWEMNPTDNDYGSPINSAPYTVTLNMKNLTGVTDRSTVRIVKAAGSNDPQTNHTTWTALTFGSTPVVGNDNTDFKVSGTTTGFSWFGAGSGNSNPLPVELISFTGFCKDNQTTINWKTASEFNSSHYIVENSTDGQNWRTVNNQVAAGMSTEELSYQFIDNANNDENTYYRLTQVDINGETNVYDPIFISCDDNGSFIKTYPNPSDASFQVMVNNKSLVGKASITMLDTRGTTISVKEVMIEEGVNVFYLNENMAPGIYYISITNGLNSTEVVKHSVR